MNLRQLQYFLATAEHGSFTAAARSLYVAQPSLSEQVRQLEAELGVELFARVGRGIALTEAGRALRPEAERVLAGVEQARDVVRDVRELRGGTLSFGMFGTASDYLIADLVGDFRRRYPDVGLRLVGQNSSLVADAVRTGRLEAALVVLPVDDDGLDLRPVHREELVVVGRSPERLGETMTIERLAELPLVLYDAEYGWADPMRRQLAERAQLAGVTLCPRSRSRTSRRPSSWRVAGSATRSSRARCSGPCAARARSTRCRSRSRSGRRSRSSRGATPRSRPRPAPSSSSWSGGSSASAS